MKKKIIIPICLALVLVLALSSVRLFRTEPDEKQTQVFAEGEEKMPKEPEIDVVPEEMPEEQKEDGQKEQNVPEKAEVPSNNHTCTLSVRCDTAVSNKDTMESEKAAILPEDGVIFPEQTVTFNEGESVYDVLLREMINANIHMESENTPMYKSAYIKGIANLYEYDCGPLSGWMYKVNGEFPNYGCSGYSLKDGDRIEWVYTCDLGADVGNENS